MTVLFLIVFIDLVGFGLVLPLLPFYGERFGASPDQVTLMMATYSLFQLIFSPLWGALSDRIGRRPVLMVSVAGSALSYLWLGVADALWMLFAARALAGAMAGNIAAAQAYIADVTTPENRSKGMGLIGAAFGLGFIFGPAIGGLLAGSDPDAMSISLPAFAGAGLSAIALLGTLIFLKESLPAERRQPGTARPSRLSLLAQAWRRPPLQRLLIVFFLMIFAFAGMETTFALWANRQVGWGPAQVGYLFAAVGVVGAVMQGTLAGPLTRRFGETRLLIAGCLLIAAGLAGLPLATQSLAVLPACLLLAAGFSLAQPSINSLISQQAGTYEVGGIMGVAQSIGSLARVLGPAFAGYLFAGLGHNAPYVAGAAIMAGVAAAVLLVRPQQAKLKEADNTSS
jgi:MFS transporter, DHA1 family, tetracycline resistance protein